MHDVKPVLEDVDLVEVVHTAIERTAKIAGEHTVKADLPAQAVLVPADRKLLTLATVNLIVNALKFSNHHSPIVVRLVESADAVRVEVEDSGPGVPPGTDVWTELVRGVNAEGIPGSGLGLPLVRLIAEVHGGSATLRSSASWTVASIELPRS